MKTLRPGSISVAAFLFICWTVASNPASAQLNQNCIVSVLNRNVQVNANGTWILPTIPANFGRVRARATCVENGVTSFGESAYFTVPANGSVTLPPIVLGPATPIPTSLPLSAPSTTLNTAGATVQLGVLATYPNGQSADVTVSDSDGDGIPDDAEIGLGLNPNNSTKVSQMAFREEKLNLLESFGHNTQTIPGVCFPCESSYYIASSSELNK